MGEPNHNACIIWVEEREGSVVRMRLAERTIGDGPIDDDTILPQFCPEHGYL